MRKKCSLDGWEGNELAHKDPQGWDLELECPLVLRLEYLIFTTIFPETMSLLVIFFLSGETINYELPMLDLFPAICGQMCSAYT